MKKHLLQAVCFLAAIALCAACSVTRSQDGPGMIVTFSNGIKGKKVDVLRARTANGVFFPTPGSLGPAKNPMKDGGATMGAAPDGRELPQWVEFEWKVWPYPYPDMPAEPVALQAWSDGVHAMSRSLPIQTARVAVRSRVPQDVIDEVLASNRQRAPNALPDKDLWVYFIWYETGIKFRWRLLQGCCKMLREGGDELAP
ncbi:hypothetical protein [Janthinobacterium sp. FW305-128]|uniref:hypothetical protein n=1 Tax=Janthinobacterium sp. FW305-128 TaxID=2775055 RepID=UPI001E343064|nr:hypothetical protein [Janthinobacterium sp. FW305-128]MCC7680291.1 hypothetical protein [Janthinobacterium sp. FW305-128]